MRPGRVPVLWITGPAGVGKSTIGFQLYLRCRRAGLTAGYIDLDQIGFLAPQPNGDPLNHRFQGPEFRRNLADLPRRRSQPPGDIRPGRQPGRAPRLRGRAAGHGDHGMPPARRPRGAEAADHDPRCGGSWPQPGDPLRGQPESYLSTVAERAAADALALEHAPLDALRIDTTGRTADEAAGLLAAAARWPGEG